MHKRTANAGGQQNGMLLHVAVKPGSKEPGIAISGDTVTLRVRERAIDGAANEGCIRALAGALGVAPSRVHLVRGARSRHKTFAIDGINETVALERLRSRGTP